MSFFRWFLSHYVRHITSGEGVFPLGITLVTLMTPLLREWIASNFALLSITLESNVEVKRIRKWHQFKKLLIVSKIGNAKSIVREYERNVLRSLVWLWISCDEFYVHYVNFFKSFLPGSDELVKEIIPGSSPCQVSEQLISSSTCCHSSLYLVKSQSTLQL